MAEDIESLDFRRHARRNGIAYGCLFIYKKFDVDLLDFGMPEYRSKSAVGAIESFVGLLQNINDKLDNDPKAKMAKNLPGVDTPAGDFAKTLSLSGPMYFTGFKDYEKVMKDVNEMVHNYGWRTISSTISVTYQPNSPKGQDLYGEDPVTAASRAMMLSSMAHMKDAVSVLTGAGIESDADYANTIAKLETEGLGNSFKQGKDAFMMNTGAEIAAKWRNAGNPVRAKVEGAPVATSVNMVPSSLKLTPSAYVIEDANGLYPTKMDVSLTLQNPYGRLFPTNTDTRA